MNTRHTAGAETNSATGSEFRCDNRIITDHHRPSPTAGGERGESGENPGAAQDSAGRKAGESGRILGESAYTSPKYPIHALGPLVDVCLTITENAQIDPAMVGQSLLCAVSLATQGVYEVETLSGFKPLSLYCLTVAESGDGKSTAEGMALAEIKRVERERHNAFSQRTIAKGEDEPPAPYMIASDATVQGVIKGLKTGWPSQGVFTAEGATMLCGWGMSTEQRANTSASLNRLWDGESVSVSRGTEGRTQLYNRRFCAHWLIQPSAAQEALLAADLAEIGLWPRFLISWPEPLAPRKYRQYRFWEDEIIKAYWLRCRELLNIDILADDGGCMEFRPIRLSHDARQLLSRYFERMEEARAKSNPLHGIKPFAVRSCELACRVAGTLAAFAGETQITEARIREAIILIAYSLDTWRGIFGKREDLEHERWARELYEWIASRDNRRATETAMLKLAIPKHLRSRHKRDVALALLQSHGLIRRAVELTPGGELKQAQNEWEAAHA